MTGHGYSDQSGNWAAPLDDTHPTLAELLSQRGYASGGFVGNLLAVVKPPSAPPEEGQLERAPVARSLAYAALGLVAAVWALATLIAGGPAAPRCLTPPPRNAAT